jgi:hypothetical protein
MGLKKITVWGYECLRCGYKWVPRGLDEAKPGEKPAEPDLPPVVCPHCRSPYWNRPRRRS